MHNTYRDILYVTSQVLPTAAHIEAEDLVPSIMKVSPSRAKSRPGYRPVSLEAHPYHGVPKDEVSVLSSHSFNRHVLCPCQALLCPGHVLYRRVHHRDLPAGPCRLALHVDSADSPVVPSQYPQPHPGLANI